MTKEQIIKASVTQLLKTTKSGWTIQGLGMLRLYLTKNLRLHVWDSRYAIPGVSVIHTHPWTFDSYVVAGVVRNIRYTYGDGTPYERQMLHCGEGGGLIGEKEVVSLRQGQVEEYREGESYSQIANEIHSSSPMDGTVTIVDRNVVGNPDHAYVFWNYNEKWLSAEPRPARIDEVQDIVNRSLSTWFK